MIFSKQLIMIIFLTISIYTTSYTREYDNVDNTLTTTVLYSKLSGVELQLSYITLTPLVPMQCGGFIAGGQYAAKAGFIFGGYDGQWQGKVEDFYGHFGISYYKAYDDDLHYIGTNGLITVFGLMALGLGVYYPMINPKETDVGLLWDISVGLSHTFVF